MNELLKEIRSRANPLGVYCTIVLLFAIGTLLAAPAPTKIDNAQVGQLAVSGVSTLTTTTNTSHFVGNSNVTVRGALINKTLTYPGSDGTSNQVMYTDGAGNLSWINPTNFLNSIFLRKAGDTATGPMTWQTTTNSGHAVINSNLTVTGVTTLGATSNSTLDVSGATTMEGSLTSTTNAFFKKSVIVQGANGSAPGAGHFSVKDASGNVTIDLYNGGGAGNQPIIDMYNASIAIGTIVHRLIPIPGNANYIWAYPTNSFLGVGTNVPDAMVHVNGTFHTESNATFGANIIFKRKAVTGFYTNAPGDYYVSVTNYAGLATVTNWLPVSVTNGVTFVLKDGVGSAAATNIVWATLGGYTIDGAANTTISSNFGSKKVILNSVNTNWETW